MPRAVVEAEIPRDQIPIHPETGLRPAVEGAGRNPAPYRRCRGSAHRSGAVPRGQRQVEPAPGQQLRRRRRLAVRRRPRPPPDRRLPRMGTLPPVPMDAAPVSRRGPGRGEGERLAAQGDPRPLRRRGEPLLDHVHRVRGDPSPHARQHHAQRPPARFRVVVPDRHRRRSRFRAPLGVPGLRQPHQEGLHRFGPPVLHGRHPQRRLVVARLERHAAAGRREVVFTCLRRAVLRGPRHRHQGPGGLVQRDQEYRIIAFHHGHGPSHNPLLPHDRHDGVPIGRAGSVGGRAEGIIVEHGGDEHLVLDVRFEIGDGPGDGPAGPGGAGPRGGDARLAPDVDAGSIGGVEPRCPGPPPPYLVAVRAGDRAPRYDQAPQRLRHLQYVFLFLVRRPADHFLRRRAGRFLRGRAVVCLRPGGDDPHLVRDAGGEAADEETPAGVGGGDRGGALPLVGVVILLAGPPLHLVAVRAGNRIPGHLQGPVLRARLRPHVGGPPQPRGAGGFPGGPAVGCVGPQGEDPQRVFGAADETGNGVARVVGGAADSGGFVIRVAGPPPLHPVAVPRRRPGARTR